MRFDRPKKDGRELKIPQMCWNRIDRRAPWEGTLLDGIVDGEYMYFVHSYYVQPQDPDVVLSATRYGDIEFCSSLQEGKCICLPVPSGTQHTRASYISKSGGADSMRRSRRNNSMTIDVKLKTKYGASGEGDLLQALCDV